MKCIIVSKSTVYGGAEAYLNRLYSQISARGVDPVLIGAIPGWAEEGLRDSDMPLSPKWTGATILTGAFRLPKERVSLSQTVMSELPTSLFHMQYKREQIGFTGILAKYGPVIWTEHGRFLRGPKGALLGAGYRAAARKTAAIICVSDDVAADVRKVVGRKPRIEVIPNAIDTSAFKPPTAVERINARASLGLDPDTPVAVWVGRVHDRKRPEIAVELASSKEWRGVVLLAGDGPELDVIRLAARNTPNLRVLGHVDHTQDIYRAADVALFTSTGSEGYPTTTMLESSSFGIPLLTNEGSGAGRYVMAAGGDVLPETATGDQWARAAHRLCTPQARLNARAWGEQHDVVAWVDAHERVFKSVLKSR